MAWLGTGTAPAAPTTVPKTHTSSHVGLGHAVRAGAAAAKRARHRPHTLCRPGARLEPNSLGRAQGAAGTARAPRLRSPPAVSPPRAALPSCGPSPAASPATAATRSPALRAPRAPERLSAQRSAAGKHPHTHTATRHRTVQLAGFMGLHNHVNICSAPRPRERPPCAARPAWQPGLALCSGWQPFRHGTRLTSRASPGRVSPGACWRL